MVKSFDPPCSDEAVKAKTGRDWSEWCTLLDAEGATALVHRDLAKLINLKHSGGGWWSETVAVGYERRKGKRSLYGRSDGKFCANTSKTIPMSSAEAHAFFVDGRKRARWLNERIVVRKATAPKSVKISWSDATNVDVQISAKGESKCAAAVEHSKLNSQEAVLEQKEFWKRALERLANIAM